MNGIDLSTLRKSRLSELDDAEGCIENALESLDRLAALGVSDAALAAKKLRDALGSRITRQTVAFAGSVIIPPALRPTRMVETFHALAVVRAEIEEQIDALEVEQERDEREAECEFAAMNADYAASRGVR